MNATTIVHEWLIDQAENGAHPAQRSSAAKLEPLFRPSSGPKTALNTWLAGRGTVDTFQITVRDGRPVRYWNPGPRPVDTSRATYARFGESRRDYAGLKTIYSDDARIVVEDSDEYETTVIAYREVTQ